MYGDKIVLLDGAGGSGSSNVATEGLLSMIPSLITNAIGGNKMDPNLVAALMNGRNNQDAWGGQGCWWMWILLLFWMRGGYGFGGFGGGNFGAGLPAELNGNAGRELLAQMISNNGAAIDKVATSLNCSNTSLQSAVCNLQSLIQGVANQVGVSYQGTVNAVDSMGCEIGNKISSCCCTLQNLISQNGASIQNAIAQQGNAIQNSITQQGFNSQLQSLNQTNTLQAAMNSGFNSNRESATSQFNILSAKIDAQTSILNDKFCELEKREMQNKIDTLNQQKTALETSAIIQQQTANLVNQLRPTPVPSYPSCSPYQSYNWGQLFGNCCCGQTTCCQTNCCTTTGAAV